MSIKKNKEELELMSNKDIAAMILEDSKRTYNTADLFKKIIKLLELPDSTFEKKIADFYTSLATDKRFVLLQNGKWDLRSNHTSDKVARVVPDEDEEEDEEEETEPEKIEDIEDTEDNYDDTDDNTDFDNDTNEDLKDLVVLDDDDIDIDQ